MLEEVIEKQTPFVPWTKIARLNRAIVVSEKIDGTNGVIHIEDDFTTMLVGSRTKWITPQNDNYGFARWAEANKAELLKLGPGTHYGEWWGSGIQRGYGLTKGEKRFSLFNTERWHSEFNLVDLSDWAETDRLKSTVCLEVPVCHVVPVVGRCNMNTEAIKEVVYAMVQRGSYAALGFMNPEGVVIFHTHNQTMFKVTVKNDELHKGEVG